jgi:hypothetical protein
MIDFMPLSFAPPLSSSETVPRLHHEYSVVKEAA